MSSSPLKPLQHPPLSRPSYSTSTPHTAGASAGPAGGGAAPGSASAMGDRNLASSSASSSQTAQSSAGRADQVLYRFYLKTVGVLVEGRVTHYGKAPGDQKKPDQWFNLLLPENDLHKADLQIFRSISSFPPYTQPELPSPSSDPCSVPPLLVAFILDTTDVPNGQAIVWNRAGGKVALDMNLLGTKGKGKEDARTGIVLERWTFRAQTPTSSTPSSSQIAPHTAYRLGIIHFRALHSLIRLLPAYRLFRRLRRSNTGLRMGIKLWAPEGYPNSPEGLDEAWRIMERGLVPLHSGLDEFVLGEDTEPEEPQRYDFPPLELFGNAYALSGEYRPEVDFSTEDMEALLSEKFVDMDEDWFTPTVAARRRSDSASSVATAGAGADQGRSRRASGPPGAGSAGSAAGVSTTTSPIPPRQQAAPASSFASAAGSWTASRAKQVSGVGSGGAAGSAGGSTVGSQRAAVGRPDRWAMFGEGLPFAGGSGSGQGDGQPPSSPSMGTPAAIVAARRLSGHSIQPFASVSPSTSLIRSTPPQPPYGAPIPTSAPRPVLGAAAGGSHPSSIGRTSSFLSQSGRSFTHAQIANMQAGYVGSASPPVTGVMSGVGHPPASPPLHHPAHPSPISPSSLSFTKQPVPRSFSGRQFYMTPSGASSPFIPESLEREPSVLATTGAGSAGSAGTGVGLPQIRRYSSSLSQRQPHSRPVSGVGLPSGPGQAVPGSQGSSAEGSLPGSLGYGQAQGAQGAQGLLRRTSTRESGLRHSHSHGQPYGSVDRPRISVSSQSQAQAPPADEDEIQAFLKTLDALPQPPSLAAQARQTSRSYMPSTSSSLSGQSGPSGLSGPTSPRSMGASGVAGSPGGGSGRVPMTRAQVEDELKRMAGSFSFDGRGIGLDVGPSGSASRVGSGVGTGVNTTTTTTAASSVRGSARGSISSGTHPTQPNTPSSIGLLSASRPGSASRRIPSTSITTGVTTAEGGLPMHRRGLSGGPSPLGPGSSSQPRGSPLGLGVGGAGQAMQPLRSADGTGRFPSGSGAGLSAGGAGGGVAARSLPGSGVPHADIRSRVQARPLVAAGDQAEQAQEKEDGSTRAGVLSPQTTGGTSTSANTGASTTAPGVAVPTSGTTDTRTNSRRGPVLLRGGFGDPRTSAASSPSHSPVRDYAGRGLGGGVGLGITGRDRDRERYERYERGERGEGGGVQVGSVPVRGSGHERQAEEELGLTSAPAPGVGRSGASGYPSYSRRQSASIAAVHALNYPSPLNGGALGAGTAAPTTAGAGGNGNSGAFASNLTAGFGSPRPAKGQRTAPSSLGHESGLGGVVERERQAGGGFGRAQQRRVGSDGVGTGGARERDEDTEREDRLVALLGGMPRDARDSTGERK
ncbi:hypothetical protein IAT38_008031 [Cryptococcus sp. DSM 104549]